MSIQKLNIPLGNKKTARPSRRAVWHRLFGAVLVVALPWLLVHVWFERDTLSTFAPSETIAIVRLVPTTKEWQTLLADFDDWTPLANRPFRLRDIAPWVQREIAIFFLSDGSRVLALQSRKNLMPVELLGAFHIFAQNPKKNIWILSESSFPLPEKTGVRLPTPSLLSNTIGEIRFPYKNAAKKSALFSGKIRLEKKDYRIQMPKQMKEKKHLALPESVLAASIIPKGPLDGLSDFLLNSEYLLAALGQKTPSRLSQALSLEGGSIIFTKSDDSNIEILLNINKKPDNLNIQDVLKELSAVQHPTNQPLTLPDNSIASEIILDPSVASVDEFSLGGRQVFRTTMDSRNLFLVEDAEGFTLATSQNLLEFSLKKDETLEYQSCSKQPLVVFRTQPLSSLFMGEQRLHSNLLLNFFSNFREITLEKTMLRNDILLCR